MGEKFKDAEKQLFREVVFEDAPEHMRAIGQVLGLAGLAKFTGSPPQT